MVYRINPTGSFWNGGIVCVPKDVIEKNIKFADESKLKVLLLLLSNGGTAETEALAKQAGIDVTDAEEALAYWENEGVLLGDTAVSAPLQEAPAAPADAKKAFEALPIPNLTPRDIVALCGERRELADLLRSAESILASTLSNAMKSNLINMVTYYGLPVPVVVTLLNYYKEERENGKNITTRNLQSIAKDWANDGVVTLEEASAKLQELISCDELWNDVIALCRFDYKKPTSAQRKMLLRWRRDFEKETIFFACNTMKKYNDEDKRSLKIVDNILKEWKRKGLKTPEDVKAQPKKEEKKKADGRLKTKPSFDIEKIKQKSVLNDDFDI